MPVCSIDGLSNVPLGAVDDLMYYCTRHTASCNSASSRGNSFDYSTSRHEITVKKLRKWLIN